MEAAAGPLISSPVRNMDQCKSPQREIAQEPNKTKETPKNKFNTYKDEKQKKKEKDKGSLLVLSAAKSRSPQLSPLTKIPGQKITDDEQTDSRCLGAAVHPGCVAGDVECLGLTHRLGTLPVL
ncbi:hypothetical protein CDD80_2783 [Ophiocordyceps camponoti-rufipedis]|uniref:Uncharacterized protein n=1 Tax=Ophiocordyceps camponoti-rufipedis TaxID=2004952 RepID=A0A2C5Z4D4_9HYPO|nr:hypothetical protein CDD80_2783 [Ophiocordyceps camponoti-rufipedis]